MQIHKNATVVVPAGLLQFQCALGVGGWTEVPAPDEQGFLEQAPLLEVSDQCCRGLVRVACREGRRLGMSSWWSQLLRCSCTKRMSHSAIAGDPAIAEQSPRFSPSGAAPSRTTDRAEPGAVVGPDGKLRIGRPRAVCQGGDPDVDARPACRASLYLVRVTSSNSSEKAME